MTRILGLWWPLLLAVALIQAGNGVTGTLVSVTSEARGFSPWLQGLVLSAFYVGSLIGALGAPAVIARSTHVASFAAFTLLLIAATVGFAVTDEPLAWAVLRFAAGFGISGMFATVESWLNLGTQDGWRARVFSIYIMVQLGGLAAGQLLLNARGFGDDVLFLSAALFSLIALGCLRFETVQNPPAEPPTRLALFELARRAPLGAACVTLAGYAWAGVMASGPALVELIGFGDFAKSMFMALVIVSGMVAQIPVGWAADHMDRRLVLAGMTGLAAASALIGLVDGAWTLFAFAALFGGATFPLYAVGVARANENLRQSERTAASAAMIVYFMIGAIAAPPMLSYATTMAGPAGYFVVQGLPHLAFALAALAALRRRSAQPS
jgi:MFS family permease